MKKIFIFLLFFLSTYFRASAQLAWIDSINVKVNSYKESVQNSFLFAHFDKNIYVQNENVWFTCYLLHRGQNVHPDVVSVSLINDDSKSVALEVKFIMAEGISIGNINIPDSIPAGNYTFLLYTNQFSHNKPTGLFTQHIKLLSTNDPKIRLTLNLDTSTINTEKIKVSLTATKNGQPLPEAKIKYFLSDSTNHPFIQNVKTDNTGHYVFVIPSKVLSSKREILSAQIKSDKEMQNVRIALPYKGEELSVKFYAECGNVVHVIACWVGLEA